MYVMHFIYRKCMLCLSLMVSVRYAIYLEYVHILYSVYLHKHTSDFEGKAQTCSWTYLLMAFYLYYFFVYFSGEKDIGKWKLIFITM